MEIQMLTEIERLNINDLTEINKIKPEYWGSIDGIHSHYLQTSNCHSIKISNREQIIVGIGTSIEFGQSGWLAHIIVSKDHQRNGIGSHIVNNRIEYLQKDCNCKTISLTATDDGYPIYKRLGFRDESLYRIMAKPQDQKFDDLIANGISKIDFADHEEIFTIDKIASGEDRRIFLKEKLNTGYVYKESEGVLGYYIPYFGDGGVIALNEIAGIELLKMRMKEDRPIYLAEGNIVAYNFLASCGYQQTKLIHRMVLGDSFEQRQTMCFSRIGGFIG